jgi:hypothetical protein
MSRLQLNEQSRWVGIWKSQIAEDEVTQNNTILMLGTEAQLGHFNMSKFHKKLTFEHLA